MYFAICEDGRLEVFETERDLCDTIPCIDVLSSVFEVYARDGIPLCPELDKPIREFKFLWFSHIFDHGTYHLVTDEDQYRDPIEIVLADVLELMPNPHFRTLDEITEFIAKHKVKGHAEL